MHVHLHSQQNIRLQIWVLAIGILILIGKFIAYFFTNSNAILTDALESIVNVSAGTLSLYSLLLSAKPKDYNHPYGHGKIEFISASVEGILISVAGLGMVGKAIYNIFEPQEVSNLDFGIWLTLGVGLLNFVLGTLLEKQGKKTHSLALISEGKHLKSDTYTTLGMVLGLALVYFTDWVVLDNLVALGFGLFILKIGYDISKKSLAGIMDEADYELLEKIIQTLEENRENNWIDIHNLRVIKFGRNIHIDCHITLPYFFTVKEANQELYKIEQIIKNIFQTGVEFFIHSDYCLPKSCEICQKTDCDVRQRLQQRKIEWTLENVLKNQMHE